MILSSRQSPRLALRRAATFDGEKSPLSSTSSRFSFNHLMLSPPPSPSLPALIARHGKPAPSPRPRRCLRMALWLAGVLSIMYFGYSQINLSYSGPKVGWGVHDDQEYEMVAGDRLPDFPTPVVVNDKRGRAKWTVSIPLTYDFPLEPEVYSEICRQTGETANHVADLHNHRHIAHAAHYDYYHVDPYFMDVVDAVKIGLLPGPTRRQESKSRGHRTGKDGSIVGEDEGEIVEKETCTKSMTFVMETSDAGLGPTLMMLWMAYGLAQKEGRAFFIDDSRWAYGKYTSFFKPPPMPDCLPPPHNERLPCPHHAHHLVVSAATARWTFGGSFDEYFEDGRKMEVYRQKPIYEFARAGYEALFNLAEDDAAYVEKRIKELKAKTTIPKPRSGNGLVIGVHVRHGDLHPWEFQYSDSYIPLYRYNDKARDILQSVFNSSGKEGMVGEMHSIIAVASDDPEVYESEEFSHAAHAQEQIRLASKKAITTAAGTNSAGMAGAFKRFVEETVGWEGGFFAPMFWSLGRARTTPAKVAEHLDAKLPPTPEALRLRELVGRAYLMDLAVLGKAGDAVVCGVSATGCKLLAVMMGWERAFDQKAWANIDGEFDWRGVSW